MELKVESAKKELEIQSALLKTEAEERILALKEEHKQKLEELRARMPKQFAFGKKLNHKICNCNNDTRVEGIERYDESLYSIGTEHSRNGIITVKYTGLYEFEVAIRVKAGHRPTGCRRQKGICSIQGQMHGTKRNCQTVATLLTRKQILRYLHLKCDRTSTRLTIQTLHLLKHFKHITVVMTLSDRL